MAGEPKNLRAIVSGPATECSVGIAIAHFKSPLQDVVRAAQTAEKHAKNQLGRAAVAVSLFKRSGEITKWGTQWASGGMELYQEIARRLENGDLSAKFPHRVCQLLEPYCSKLEDAEDFPAVEVITREFAFATSRQSAQGKAAENETALAPLLATYLKKIRPITLAQTQLTALIGLCTTVAFAHRTRNETPKGN